MDQLHPLGEDFARWVELTDDYEARIAHASPEEMPDREELDGLAARLREAARLMHSRVRGAALHHRRAVVGSPN
ncbi:hypothetical protein ACA040_002460 [Xenophilus aerolatus]